MAKGDKKIPEWKISKRGIFYRVSSMLNKKEKEKKSPKDQK